MRNYFGIIVAKKSIVIFVSILIVLSFFLYMNYRFIGLNDLSNLASVFTIMGGGATVIASIFAISTFSDWKEQRQKEALLDFDKKMITSSLVMVEVFSEFMYEFCDKLSENPQFDQSISDKYKNMSLQLGASQYSIAIKEHELAVKKKQEYISSLTRVIRTYNELLNRVNDSKNACHLCKVAGPKERVEPFDKLNYICRNIALHAMQGNIKVLKKQSFSSFKPIFSIENITVINGLLDDTLKELKISDKGLMEEIEDISIKIGKVYLDSSKEILHVNT